MEIPYLFGVCVWPFQMLLISDTQEHSSYNIADTMKRNLKFIAFISNYEHVKNGNMLSTTMFHNLIHQYEICSKFITTRRRGKLYFET